jgi:hypothetical protein
MNRGPVVLTTARVEDWFAALEAARFLEQVSRKRGRVPDGIVCRILLEGQGFIHALDAHGGLKPEIRRVYEEILGLAAGR